MEKEIYDSIKDKIIGQINAAQAKEKSTENASNLIVLCLDKIYEEIKNRAKYGYTHAIWNTKEVSNTTGYVVPDRILRDVVEYLLIDKYTIRHDSAGEIRIEW